MRFCHAQHSGETGGAAGKQAAAGYTGKTGSTAGKQAVPRGTPEKQAVPRYAAWRRTGGMRLRRLQRKGEMF